MSDFTFPPPFFGETFAPAVPTDIASIEAAVVAQLQAQINVVEIRAFRGHASAYRLTHRIGAILVRYTSSRYAKPRSTFGVDQDREIVFQADLLVRDLGWGFGGPGPAAPTPLNLVDGYAILEATRAALQGFLVPGADKQIWIENDQAYGAEVRDGNGVFTFSMNFVVTTVTVQVRPTENPPLLLDAVVAMRLQGETIDQIVNSVAPAAPISDQVIISE